MPTFECCGLMNNYKKEEFDINFKHNNFVLNGLNDPLNFVQKLNFVQDKELNIEKNNSNNIDDKEKQLCKSVARNIKENTWWINKKRSYEESLGSHCF